MIGEGEFAGQMAAEWFSKYLGEPVKLYYCTSARFIIDDSKWTDIGEPQDKVCCSILFTIVYI